MSRNYGSLYLLEIFRPLPGSNGITFYMHYAFQRLEPGPEPRPEQGSEPCPVATLVKMAV
jgi:hypothetical protein